jgi:hypothetical protein
MVMHHFEFFSMQKVSREAATATASHHVAAPPREMSIQIETLPNFMEVPQLVKKPYCEAEIGMIPRMQH